MHMHEADMPMSRKELVRRGYFYDVSPVAEQLGILIPIDVTFTLFEDYLANPDSDVGPLTNIRNNNPADRSRFTMVYPIAGGLQTVEIIAILATHQEGDVGSLFLASDVDEEEALDTHLLGPYSV